MKAKKENVGIIGLGYVGTPLAYLAAYKGYNVIGIDNDNEVIEKFKNRNNIPKELRNKKRLDLILTNDYSKLKDIDIIVICVPTPTINNVPDLTILKNVIKNVKDNIKKGSLIILESTVAPGMTKKYIIDYFIEKNNLKVNEDYYLAYCPERIDPGNNKYWVGNINRVCGATSQQALNRVVQFYKTLIEGKVIPMKSIEEAELVKVWENSIRNISIAQANLLAIICDKYNFSVKEILNALNSKVEQFGLSLAYPGIGPGGHCIPEDIHYLIETFQNNMNIDTTLLKESVKINQNMPQYAFDKLVKRIEKNGSKISLMKILLLGVSYKPNSNDIRRSQALVLYDIIKQDSKEILIYDPIVQSKDEKYLNKKNFEKYIKEADIVVVGCAHDIFVKLDYTKYKNIKYILDCWNKLDADRIKNVGINYIGVGE